MGEMRATLEAVRAFLVEAAAEMTSYGFFPGGDFDPRDFAPDSENTPEELEAHRLAVEAWSRGERPKVKRSGRTEDVTLPAHKDRETGEIVPERTGSAIVCGSPYGMGAVTYRDADAVALLARIDAALAGERPPTLFAGHFIARRSPLVALGALLLTPLDEVGALLVDDVVKAGKIEVLCGPAPAGGEVSRG